MIVRWYAHSCFLLTTDESVRILTDPFESGIGYELPAVEADVVTSSHDHYDHNYVTAVQGNPIVINTKGTHEAHGVRITGIETWHDDQQGAERGPNLVYVYEIDGMRVAHLGDIGELPSEDVLHQIGEVDVLLTPVGGVYTIDPRTACDIANKTKTKVLIPMHYQTAKLTLKKKLLGVDTLLGVSRDCRIHKLNQSICTITKDSLGEDRILVFTPYLDK